jgi:hypothetical protein
VLEDKKIIDEEENIIPCQMRDQWINRKYLQRIDLNDINTIHYISLKKKDNN